VGRRAGRSPRPSPETRRRRSDRSAPTGPHPQKEDAAYAYVNHDRPHQGIGQAIPATGTTKGPTLQGEGPISAVPILAAYITLITRLGRQPDMERMSYVVDIGTSYTRLFGTRCNDSVW